MARWMELCYDLGCSRGRSEAMGLGILPGISSMAADLGEEASYRIEGHQLPQCPASFAIRTTSAS